MIRVLVMIAVTGFLVSVVTLSTAVAIGGPDLVSDGIWRWGRHGDWNFTFDDDWGSRHRRGRWDRAWSDGGPQTTREVAWSGGDSLEIDVPADVTYAQGAGPGKLTISGPKDVVDAIEVEDGRIRIADDHRGAHWGDLTISMTAPAVTHFDMSGSGKLAITGYRQDKLSLDLSGNADVTASGEARSLALNISGSSNADLGGLKTRSADVDIQGSGDATVAPADEAKIDISGSGDVTLLTHPARLESNVSGSGSVRQEGSAATPSPSGTPSPNPPPKRAKRI